MSKTFSKEEVISLLENYNDYCVSQIRQYCDREDIPELEEFVSTYTTEYGETLDEESVKEMLDDWKACLKCYTGSVYTEEEMKYFQNRTGVSYKHYNAFEFLSNYLNFGENFWEKI